MRFSFRKVAAAVCLAAVLMASSAFAGTEKSKVAVFHLDGPLMERPMGDIGFSFGNQPETLKGLIERFHNAGRTIRSRRSC